MSPGQWKVTWADEFDGEGVPEKWYPKLTSDPSKYKDAEAKGLRWSGSSEESAWMYRLPRGEPEYMKHCFNVAHHWGKKDASESEQFNSASRPLPQEYADITDDKYHVYGLEWSTDEMKIYVDGRLAYTFTENIPSDPVDMMMMTLEFKPNMWDPNQGDGRTEGPFVSDNDQVREMSRVLVDYVRVYQRQQQ